MFCGKCGKRVHDDMLFCPFCGSAIVIPDQEVKPDPLPEPTPQEEFVPLNLDFDAPEQKPTPETKPETKSEDSSKKLQEAREVEPPIFAPAQAQEKRKKEDTEVPKTRGGNTFVPFRDVNPNDLFMDDKTKKDDPDDEYDHDRYDNDRDDFDFDEDYDSDRQQKAEEGGFFHRHIRGFVALMLVIVVLAVCAVWAFSDGGQNMLAKFNLAWTAEPYAHLGFEAYGAEDYTLAAKNYSRAVELDPKNYEYAHSSMVAEYMADNIDGAVAMAKKCIEMNPDSIEPYADLKSLFTNREIPDDVRELLLHGSMRTGDNSLVVS